MTNINYTKLSNEQLLSEIKSLNKRPEFIKSFLQKQNPLLLDEIISRTTFLDEYYKEDNVPMPARLYCLRYNLSEQPKCQNPECPNKSRVEWRSKEQTFAKYCSRKCCHSDEQHWERVKETNNRRYGGNSPFCSKDVRNTYRKNLMQKHGVENAFQIKEVQEKIKQKNLELRGVEYPMQCKDVKLKAQHSFEIHYGEGLVNPFQSEEVKEKIKQTHLKNLGFPNPMQSQDIKNKSVKTNIQKRGVPYPTQSIDVINKRKENCLKNFGITSKTQLEATKQKTKETNNLHWGYDYYTQSPQYHKNAHKPYTNDKYPDMTFGSSWEFKVYDFLTENHMEFEYQPNISFDYYLNDERHTYHPDFRLSDGRIVEVKGDQYYRINESTGVEEMYCPYRYSEWSDEYYAYKCALYEAKHQCMIANNVIIIRGQNLNNLKDVFNL